MFYNYMFGYREYCGTIRLTYAPSTLMQINWVYCTKSFQLRLTLCDPMDSSSPGSSGHRILLARILPCPPPADLPDLGIEHVSPAAPALQGGSLPLRHWESPLNHTSVQFSSVQSLSCVWLLRPHGLQQPRLPCPSPTPGVYSNSCPLSRWCHLAILSSVAPFSSLIKNVITVIF